MYTVKIFPVLINGRLDATFYDPNVGRLLHTASKQGFKLSKLRELIYRMNSGPFGSALHASDYVTADKGIIFYRPVDCKSCIADPHNENVYISQEDNVRLKSSSFISGSILVTQRGNGIGDISVVPKSTPICNISANMIGFILKSADPYYVTIFFHSVYGATQIHRGIIGGPMPKIDKATLLELIVPVPCLKAQTYIGDKVRQAERLRERARQLEKQFQNAIEDKYPDTFGPIQLKSKFNLVNSKIISENLNAGAYNPERIRIRQAIEHYGGKRISDISEIVTPTSSHYSANDLYIGLDSISSGSCSISPSTIADQEVEGTVRILNEGPAISKLRPYLNKVTYIPQELSGAYGSTELLCIKPQPGISGWFIYGVLKLESTMRQLNPVATGATHPRVSREDVLDLMVPWLEEAARLGKLLEQAQISYFASERLTIAAKLLVEALIEGRITESELIATQESLEHNETALDKKVLSELTRKSNSKQSEMLFPDLDALYDALAQVSSTAEEARVG